MALTVSAKEDDFIRVRVLAPEAKEGDFPELALLAPDGKPSPVKMKGYNLGFYSFQKKDTVLRFYEAAKLNEFVQKKVKELPKPWLEVPLTGESCIIFFNKQIAKGKTEWVPLVISDDVGRFPGSSRLVINLTARPVRVAMAVGDWKIAPGASRLALVDNPDGEALRRNLFFYQENSGAEQEISNERWTFSPRMRGLVLVAAMSDGRTRIIEIPDAVPVLPQLTPKR